MVFEIRRRKQSQKKLIKEEKLNFVFLISPCLLLRIEDKKS